MEPPELGGDFVEQMVDRLNAIVDVLMPLAEEYLGEGRSLV